MPITNYSPSKAIQVEEAEMFKQGKYIGDGGKAGLPITGVGFKPTRLHVWAETMPGNFKHFWITKISNADGKDIFIQTTPTAVNEAGMSTTLDSFDADGFTVGYNNPTLNNFGVTYYYVAMR